MGSKEANVEWSRRKTYLCYRQFGYIASNFHCFSRKKLFEHEIGQILIRSTISENRLNGLTWIFIHRYLTLQISNHEILDHFTQSGVSRHLKLIL
ncbi:hypothetical protein PR048_018919 [Dryococelus australis]|uniref:Uncharacterized protein n=1 Tax=Dryococelus australis TaxID=614101 RepID=A0ABQ9H212_9NEOP|nr:hypothetical protein PR048_018919 [Dryococelus australis]